MDRRRFITATGMATAGRILTAGSARASSTDSIDASVTVEPEKLHDLPREQYGHFIEHIGKCIKGGIWAEGESADMFQGGVRWELIEAMKSIRPPLIRYPGGCFADGYHWKDGIGPRSERPLRPNLAWGKQGKELGPDEDNHFGTDEFLLLCEEVGTDPERAANGHPEPYGVKYWFVGNEIPGVHEIGYQSPSVYCGTVRDYAAAMRAIDPAIKIIGCGTFYPPGIRDDINRTVLKGAGHHMDYLSVHQYSPNAADPGNLIKYQFLKMHLGESKKAYYDILGSLRFQEDFLARCALDARTHSPSDKFVPLTYDEWGLWFVRFADNIQANYNFRDGLWTAGSLNTFHRFAKEAPLCNVAQMVNCLGIITSTDEGTFLTPSALVFKLYAQRAGDHLLPSQVDCPVLPHKAELPALDVSATRAGDKVALFMVNRHLDAEIIADCELIGLAISSDAKRTGLYSPDPFVYNTYEDPEAVALSETSEVLNVSREGSSSRFTVRLDPHSLSCLELNVNKL